MKPSNIIYADLSTYEPIETMPFYEHVFGWSFLERDGMYIAYIGSQEIMRIYETPTKFKMMKMPHFWMTYVQVDSVTKTVAKARELGAIIEMQQSLEGYGRVALIRDPQGAGFTIYEGDSISPTRTDGQRYTLIWNELHISDAGNVIPFYESIFDWTFDMLEAPLYKIRNGKDEHIADALEIPNEHKGKYEYWVCTFGVEDLMAAKSRVLEAGGAVIIDEGARILVYDNGGEAFFYIQQV